MRPNFFFGSATYIQLDWLFTDKIAVYHYWHTDNPRHWTNNQQPTTNTKYLDLRKKRVKWRCDEIWKLHNIKLNLISTLSLIDGWFHYAYTFSVKIKKKPFSRNEIHFIWIWMRKFNLHQIIHFLRKTFAHLIIRMRPRTIQFLQTFS